jgi:hypothetical protein
MVDEAKLAIHDLSDGARLKGRPGLPFDSNHRQAVALDPVASARSCVAITSSASSP